MSCYCLRLLSLRPAHGELSNRIDVPSSGKPSSRIRTGPRKKTAKAMRCSTRKMKQRGLGGYSHPEKLHGCSTQRNKLLKYACAPNNLHVTNHAPLLRESNAVQAKCGEKLLKTQAGSVDFSKENKPTHILEHVSEGSNTTTRAYRPLRTGKATPLLLEILPGDRFQNVVLRTFAFVKIATYIYQCHLENTGFDSRFATHIRKACLGGNDGNPQTKIQN